MEARWIAGRGAPCLRVWLPCFLLKLISLSPSGTGNLFQLEWLQARDAESEALHRKGRGRLKPA
jgi:hypothetical protein